MILPLTEACLELPRTATELGAFIHDVRGAVQCNAKEFACGIQHKGLYKEFIDEVLPLCKFAALAYPSDFKVQWKSGNQGYDAIVLDAGGTEVDRIELARPHDGKQRSEDGKRLSAGPAFARFEVIDDMWLEHIKEFIKSSAESKSTKDYGGMTLVFAPFMHPPIKATEAQFEQQICELEKSLASYQFIAKRVVLLVPGQLRWVQGE